MSKEETKGAATSGTVNKSTSKNGEGEEWIELGDQRPRFSPKKGATAIGLVLDAWDIDTKKFDKHYQPIVLQLAEPCADVVDREDKPVATKSGDQILFPITSDLKLQELLTIVVSTPHRVKKVKIECLGKTPVGKGEMWTYRVFVSPKDYDRSEFKTYLLGGHSLLISAAARENMKVLSEKAGGDDFPFGANA